MTSVRTANLRTFFLAFTTICAIIFASLLMPGSMNAQSSLGSCEPIQYLMDAEITPYDAGITGGIIENNLEQTGGLASDQYLNTWVFRSTRPLSETGLSLPGTIVIQFSDVEIPLEFRLFYGMEPVANQNGNSNYLPVLNNTTSIFPLTGEGLYTLIVRRTAILDQTPGSYRVIAGFPTTEAPITLNNLRNNTTGSTHNPPPILENGHTLIDLTTQNGDREIRIHAGAATSISTPNNTAFQVRYGTGEQFGLLINDWADQLLLIGGDLAVQGQRTLFIEDYGYAVNMLDGNFGNVTDSNGNQYRLSWDYIRGIWITRDCVGFKTLDGHQFFGEINRDNRSITLQGTADAFIIGLAGRSGVYHQMQLNWQGVETGYIHHFQDQRFTLGFIGTKRLVLESTDIILQRSTRTDVSIQTPLEINLRDRDATLLLDWVGIDYLNVGREDLTIHFQDARGLIQRLVPGLARFTALDEVVQIIEQGQNDVPGAQRLLLPEAEGYVEMITDAGFPAFNPSALPDDAGYAPRALNNLGGECYPINTMQPEANCPPNGHPNPANGNIWYAITDLQAFGEKIDLALTRSYNSSAARINGPFGPGWSTTFQLDYVPSDENTGTAPLRPVDASTIRSHPVGLDLAWAPRGIVTFYTPSGSRHIFTSSSDNYISGTMTALTMPGWSLSRDNIQDPEWELVQDNGLTYYFDRAGRLKRYGFPQHNRMITITYPAQTLKDLGSTPVIITDAAEERQLELYYDTTQRIVRSVLRDTTQNADTDNCTLSANCYETRYDYTDGYLTRVDYADGTQAQYAYDENGKLRFHDDPRAPVSRRMTYQHGDNGSLSIQIHLDDDSIVNWRRIQPTDDTANVRQVVVAYRDEPFTFERVYRYDLMPTTRKTAGSTFTLLERRDPIVSSNLDALPASFEWSNGLLTRNLARLLPEEAGRNSTIYEYGEAGYNPVRIRSGYPGFNATYQSFAQRYLPVSLTFGDGSSQTFTYDDQGQVLAMTDRFGGTTAYTWEAGQIVSAQPPDGIDIIYSYNALGLVETVTQQYADDSYTITYDYDGLGRLTDIIDPVIGDYTITYDEPINSIILQNTHGSRIIITFDPSGDVIQQQILQSDGTILRQTRYTYDEYHRITQERVLLTPLDDSEPTDELVTTYTYRDLRALPALPASDSTVETIINGYEIAVRDPYGRVQTYAYDALDRIRRITDAFTRIIHFDYDAIGVENGPNSLLITRAEVQGDRLISQDELIFDLRWQLRSVTRRFPDTTAPDYTWQVAYEGDTTRIRSLSSGQGGVLSQNYEDYNAGRPSQVRAVAPTLSLPERFTPIRPETSSLNAQYDDQGRLIRATDGNNVNHYLLYCDPEQKVIYTLADDATCDNHPEFQRVIYYDMVGRTHRVIDAGLGERTYDYQAIDGGWQVTMTTGDGIWELTYNDIGELTRWTDENGYTRAYRYDTAGRLRSITLEGAYDDAASLPYEARYTFTYNKANLLVSALDGLGRGTIYTYDTLGQLIVEQDARSADATVYAYSATGQLTSIISPLGNTTTFLYQDETDPSRLTGIIEPTGNVISFDWNDRNNSLAYTDSRNNTTRYYFGSLDQLWSIVDVNGVSHEFRYDTVGNLTAWIRDQQNTASEMILEHTPSQITIREPSLDWQQQITRSAQGQISSLLYDATHEGAVNFSYDALGRLTQMTAGERSWQLDFESGVPALQYVDGFGTVSQLRFDALNRLTLNQQGDAATTYTYERNSGGDVDLVIEDTTIRRYTFDSGDEISGPPSIILQTPEHQTTYIFNSEGLITEITSETCLPDSSRPSEADVSPMLAACVQSTPDRVWGQVERIIYDALGRPIRYVDAEQNIIAYAYDDAGNLTTYQDVNGKTFTYTYNTLNQLESITGPTGIRLLLSYNRLHQINGICRDRSENTNTYTDCVNTNGALETYRYDRLGRLVERNAGSTTQTYTYGTDGLLSGWGESDLTIARDALGLVTRLTGDTFAYEMEYANFSTLDSLASNAQILDYTYDESGRLSRLQIANYQLVYTYHNRGYTISEETTGTAIDFSLDDNGFLTAIGSDQFSYNLSPNERELLVQLVQQNGEQIEITLNRRGETQGILYNNSSLFFDYTTDASGQVQRQGIIGAQRFFDAGADGYIIVTGYDNDERPLTMRITRGDDGELLYLATFTYNAFGQRETETRRYGDGTQVVIQHRYNADGSLQERRIRLTAETTTEPVATTTNGSPFLLLLAFSGWILRGQRRNAFMAITFGVVIALALSLVFAQPPAPLTELYLYEGGNLIRVETASGDVCRQYTYDSANRLTAVDDEARYTYDALNRPTLIGDHELLYHGNTHTLLGVSDGEAAAIRFSGKGQNLPAFSQQQADQTTALFNDGRIHIVGINDEQTGTGDADNSIWLFDPFGRLLTLQPPTGQMTGCDFIRTSVPPALAAVAPLQMLHPGGIWDAQTNLYIIAGRAYVPEIGRYLQRNPYGPDIFGNAYTYIPQLNQPPVVVHDPAYMEGLFRMQQAIRNPMQELTHTAVIAGYLPQPSLTAAAPLLEHLDALPAYDTLTQKLDFPRWLTTSYNLSGAYLDQDGRLRLPGDNTPVQGDVAGIFRASAFRFDSATHWLPDITPIDQQISLLYPQAVPEPFVIYDPFLWQPDTTTLPDVWQNRIPDLSATPDLIWNWLPMTLAKPTAATQALDAALLLQTMPERPAGAWIQTGLAAGLPALPDLPPATSDEWLSNWFTDDTFGTVAILNDRWPALPDAHVEVFEIGPNTIQPVPEQWGALP